MTKITIIGLEHAKTVFQAYGTDAQGHAMHDKKQRPAQVLDFFSRLRLCVVAMKACGSPHDWRHKIGKPGHEG